MVEALCCAWISERHALARNIRKSRFMILRALIFGREMSNEGLKYKSRRGLRCHPISDMTDDTFMLSFIELMHDLSFQSMFACFGKSISALKSKATSGRPENDTENLRRRHKDGTKGHQYANSLFAEK